MTTLLRLRDRGAPQPFVGAAPQFGTYDMSGQTPAGRLLADEFLIQAYAGHVTDRTNPDISPVYGALRGLPPTPLVVGSLDILLGDNLVMAARLSAAGGEVDARLNPESPHGFTFPQRRWQAPRATASKRGSPTASSPIAVDPRLLESRTGRTLPRSDRRWSRYSSQPDGAAPCFRVVLDCADCSEVVPSAHAALLTDSQLATRSYVVDDITALLLCGWLCCLIVL